MKILVISLAGIGDTILATPLIRELRAAFPDALIDALVLYAGSRDVLETSPHLNTVYQRNLLAQSKLQSLKFLLPLRPIGYDVSINTHPQSRKHYRLIARIINARQRLSHVYESCGPLDGWLVNKTLPQDYTRHSVDNNLRLLTLLDRKPQFSNHRLEIFLSSADEQWAETFLDQHRLRGEKVLGIHVGSGATKNLALKRWPIENYIELLKAMKQKMPHARVLLFGGPDEESDLRRVTQEVNSPNLIRAATANLRLAAALIARCSAFLSVDTALMHVAAAVRAPNQIVIEAPTLNKTNEPYGNAFRLVRNPAIAGRHLDYYRYDGLGIKGSPEELKRLMSSISLQSVMAAVKESLADSA